MFSILGFLLVTSSQGQSSDVEDLFNLKCAICHTIGGGKLIGPDLINISEKRDREWLVEFISSSTKMIKNNDPLAVELFKENNNVLMPDPMISDDEISSILDYISAQSGGEVAEAKPYESIIANATPEDMESGRAYFEGTKRFKDGGPSCYSCHNDISDYFFSENSYSTKDIRTSFRNLGEQGVRAILENPPFPVMNKAFEGHALRDNEIHDLLVYLRDEGGSNTKTLPSSGYAIYGFGGAVLLFFLFAGFWYERKSRSVNDKIYKRQIQSSN